MTDGHINPSVAMIPPGIPAVIYPTYVAALTAIGPGVDSLTAIISVKNSCENHPVLSPISERKGIVAMPPPKANSAVLKNSKNSRR